MYYYLIHFINNKKHENTITSTEPSSRTPNPDLDDITTLEAYLLLASGLLILLLLCTIFICYRKMWVLLTIFIIIIIISSINVLIIRFVVIWMYIISFRKKQSKPIQTYAGTYLSMILITGIFDKFISLLKYTKCSWLSYT